MSSLSSALTLDYSALPRELTKLRLHELESSCWLSESLPKLESPSFSLDFSESSSMFGEERPSIEISLRLNDLELCIGRITFLVLSR